MDLNCLGVNLAGFNLNLIFNLDLIKSNPTINFNPTVFKAVTFI